MAYGVWLCEFSQREKTRSLLQWFIWSIDWAIANKSNKYSTDIQLTLCERFERVERRIKRGLSWAIYPCQLRTAPRCELSKLCLLSVAELSRRLITHSRALHTNQRVYRWSMRHCELPFNKDSYVFFFCYSVVTLNYFIWELLNWTFQMAVWQTHPAYRSHHFGRCQTMRTSPMAKGNASNANVRKSEQLKVSASNYDDRIITVCVCSAVLRAPN